ncbi:MAG TPA: hypothetical protein VJS68_03575 [Thermoplasmata archaeon]|nr:hypothetical protein [Thermoplasmata archaeon]
MIPSSTTFGPFDLPATLLQRPSSVLFWGKDPHLLALAAYGVARRVDPDFGLLEMGEPGTTPEFEPVFSLVPPDRRIRVTDPAQILPNDAASNLALFSVVRTDSPGGDAGRLVDFLWLPGAFQEVVSRIRAAATPGAVISTNLQLLVPHLNDGAAAFRRITEVLNREGVTVVMSYVTSAPRLDPPPSIYDYVFRLVRKPHREWGESILYAERASERLELPMGLPIPAKAFQPFEEACQAEAKAVATAANPERHWMVPD